VADRFRRVVVTSPRPLRAGVIGLGFAGTTHLRCYAELDGVEPVALAGQEPERLAFLAEQHSLPHVYTAWEELVARDDLDVISVCAPNYLHAPITLAALSSGKHVLCEKPLARSGAEASAMVEAAIAHDRVLHTAFNHRERGDVQLLRRYIDEGRLGRIYHAKASWMRRRGVPGAGSWFTSKDMAGGGPLIDLGVHVLDLALYLLDEPAVVSVDAATYSELGGRLSSSAAAPSKKTGSGHAFDVEDLATAFVRLAGGTTLLLEASWATHGSAGDDLGVTLFGTEGGAEMRVQNYSTVDTVRLFTEVAGAPAEVRPQVAAGEGHKAVVRAFLAAIASGDFSGHRGDAGLHRTRVVDACYESAALGRSVVLSSAHRD
jgi:predicted dehydrogenase